MSCLQIRNLFAGYGTALVIRDVSISVGEGQSVAIVGKNGAGKSTLLLSMFGGAAVIGGEIWVDGFKISGKPAYMAAKQGISLSPQGRLILPHLTVRENLLLGGACGRSGHWDLQTVFELFPVLEESQGRSGAALSGGQQQMLAVGRALLANPRVLILDEPSEGLSPVLVDGLAEVLNKIRQAGMGILVVEQHLNLVRRVTDQFVVMSKGQLIGGGLTRDIDAPEHRAAMAF